MEPTTPAIVHATASPSPTAGAISAPSAHTANTNAPRRRPFAWLRNLIHPRPLHLKDAEADVNQSLDAADINLMLRGQSTALRTTHAAARLIHRLTRAANEERLTRERRHDEAAEFLGRAETREQLSQIAIRTIRSTGLGDVTAFLPSGLVAVTVLIMFANDPTMVFTSLLQAFGLGLSVASMVGHLGQYLAAAVSGIGLSLIVVGVSALAAKPLAHIAYRVFTGIAPRGQRHDSGEAGRAGQGTTMHAMARSMTRYPSAALSLREVPTPALMMFAALGVALMAFTMTQLHTAVGSTFSAASVQGSIAAQFAAAQGGGSATAVAGRAQSSEFFLRYVTALPVVIAIFEFAEAWPPFAHARRMVALGRRLRRRERRWAADEERSLRRERGMRAQAGMVMARTVDQLRRIGDAATFEATASSLAGYVRLGALRDRMYGEDRQETPAPIATEGNVDHADADAGRIDWISYLGDERRLMGRELASAWEEFAALPALPDGSPILRLLQNVHRQADEQARGWINGAMTDIAGSSAPSSNSVENGQD